MIHITGYGVIAEKAILIAYNNKNIKGKLKVELGLGLYSYYYVIHVKFQQNDLILNSIT